MKDLNIKEKLNTKRGKRTAVAVVLLLLLALVGGLTAKYVTENKSIAEMLSSDFHISSNYLEEDGAEYTVSDWGDHGIEILLFNYEKENVKSIAGTDMKYTVTVPANWTVTVTDGAGTKVEAENNEYTFTKSAEKASHKLVLEYEGTGEPAPVKVTVTTTAPYAKTLTAEFTLEGKSGAEYKVEDKGDYCVVTVYTNDYEGDIRVTWGGKFAPDNTNPLMSTWKQDDTTDYLVGLEANTTYELIFVEHTAVEDGNQELAPVVDKQIKIN